MITKDQLVTLVQEKNHVVLKQLLANNEIVIHNGKLVTIEAYRHYDTLCELRDDYDMFQSQNKLKLNSLYGASLSAFSRFHDRRIGASTTGSGRAVTTHMAEFMCHAITGVEHKMQKEWVVDPATKELQAKYTMPGSPLIYGDTDSNYLLLPEGSEHLTDDEQVEMADALCEAVNASFAKFTETAFCCAEGFRQRLGCGREVVARRGLFIAKKKYMLDVMDLEGVRLAPGEKKAFKYMGLEMAKSDTPVVIQKFLKGASLKIIAGCSYQELCDYVIEHRQGVKVEPILLGVPRSVNDLLNYTNMYDAIENPNDDDDTDDDDDTSFVSGKLGKVRLPGHVRAAINYRNMVKHFSDKEATKISSGDKIKIFYLKRNDFKYKSIGFPADITVFPQWFIDNFNIDMPLMEKKLIDTKLEIILNAMSWETPTSQNVFIRSFMDFD